LQARQPLPFELKGGDTFDTTCVLIVHISPSSPPVAPMVSSSVCSAVRPAPVGVILAASFGDT
jgi:hypothetical protein